MRLSQTAVLLTGLLFASASCTKERVLVPGDGITANSNNSLAINALDTCSSPVIAWDITTVNAGRDQFASGTSITLDKNNNIYIAGVYKGTVDIDPGPGVFNLTGKGAYVQKLDANGNFKGAKQVPLNYEDYYIPLNYIDKGFTDIDVDAAGNVILTTFANGSANVIKAGGAGNQVFKLSLRSANESPVQTAVDSKGNLIIAGSYGGPANERFDVDPGAGIYNTPATGSGIYVLKVDASGKFQTAKFYTALTDIWDLKTDKADNIYAMGLAYENNQGIYHRFIKADKNAKILINKLSPSDNEYTPVSIDNTGNIFMGIEQVPKKYGPNGALLWGTSFTVDDVALWIHGFSGDAKGNLYVATGTYWNNNQSRFIKFNENGQELWRRNIPGITEAQRDLMFTAPDSQNNVILLVSSGPPGGSTRIIKYKACQ